MKGRAITDRLAVRNKIKLENQMADLYRSTSYVLGILLASFCGLAVASAQQSKPPTDFVKKQEELKARFEQRKGRVENEAVHKPPMIKAEASDLWGDEPVIGVSIGNDARAYPLVMLFNGGGIFELLNDTCGEQPIAVSW
jgi:hypothetical protein